MLEYRYIEHSLLNSVLRLINKENNKLADVVVKKHKILRKVLKLKEILRAYMYYRTVYLHKWWSNSANGGLPVNRLLYIYFYYYYYYYYY